MNLLVACERTGVVRDAFSAKGTDAWSCDIQPSTSPGNHIRSDVLKVLRYMPWRWNGIGLMCGTWDTMIAHPDCRFLCVSGMHWTTRGFRDPKMTDQAIAFAEALWNAPVHRIAIENPVGVLSTRSQLGPATQIIQPYEFGDDASKKTCLWLKNLPPLVPTRYIEPRIVNGKKRWANQTDNGQNKLGPSKDRWLKRATTYPGIAKAMADQWT